MIAAKPTGFRCILATCGTCERCRPPTESGDVAADLEQPAASFAAPLAVLVAVEDVRAGWLTEAGWAAVRQ